MYISYAIRSLCAWSLQCNDLCGVGGHASCRCRSTYTDRWIDRNYFGWWKPEPGGRRGRNRKNTMHSACSAVWTSQRLAAGS